MVERLAARDTEVAGAARAFLGLPDPTPEQVHRLHAELRRLRVEHRLFRSLLRPDGTDRARALDRRLAEVARRVGTVRDADVELHLLEPTPRGTRSAAASPGDLVRRLRDDARIGRELLRAYLQAELRAGLFEGLGATGRRPPGSRRPRWSGHAGGSSGRFGGPAASSRNGAPTSSACSSGGRGT